MKKFVIGDRLKDEWISVLDTEKKKLEFTNHLASAKEFNDEELAKSQLKELQRPADLRARQQQGIQARRARRLLSIEKGSLWFPFCFL